MPEITLSLPAALGLLALFLAIGAVMVFFAVRQKPEVVVPLTPTSTVTLTLTPTNTATQPPPTATGTPEPSPTPLSYSVVSGDSCISIALNYGVSVQSIIALNGLSQDCPLTVNNTLLIPQPTPTVTPMPSATLSEAELTEEACNKDYYVVKDNDTPNSIAAAYGVPWNAIKEENGLPGDVVYLGQTLVIPLCARPTPAGPTPTATIPPPYAAPALLLPADGSPFTLSDETVTLQWASVGTLREGEAYLVIVEDVTDGTGRRLREAVTDTKFIVPTSFRPTDRVAHILRWWVQPVRQEGTDRDGNPIWESAGAASQYRDFTWSGAGAGTTPTP